MKLARHEFFGKGAQTFPVTDAVAIDADEVLVIFEHNGEKHYDVFSVASAADVTELTTDPGEGNYVSFTFTPGAAASTQPTAVSAVAAGA